MLRINNDLYNPDWIVHVQFTPAAIATAGAAAAPAILKVLVANLGHVEAKGVEAETIWAELSPEDNAPLPGADGIDTNPKSATYGKAVAIDQNPNSPTYGKYVLVSPNVAAFHRP